MGICDRLKKLLAEYPAHSSNEEELTRLMEFSQNMRDAGVTPNCGYTIPPPDTLGRIEIGKPNAKFTNKQSESCGDAICGR